ncbi:carboxymuconolactone decarboxylase family protein [Actinomadura litoris]|uniref:Carboxymuconolactone decarboxylase family protein n=1 Tax=Actinomadura litoris TaxID=2678616 RepID=A0A7K1KZ24_9ACTN|nr:carboxymuconolactone decarboxylase family protein [Actinomadura litoris]MUN37399.1 carboxymuconolactone decarboxylase family protein [Actinomadura litoris]
MGSRMSNPTVLVPELIPVAGALAKATGSGSLPEGPMGLAGLRIGQIVGSTYLIIRSTEALRKAGETEERIAAVVSWRNAPYFTGAERAALALAEGVFLPAAGGERVSDALYAEASEHFDEKALATLMIGIGQVAFWSAVAVIGKPVPGVADEETWR